jgi:ubiquinone/menaquinone biosynthesis C-methylase UbiE
MNSNKNVTITREFAAGYDNQGREYGWFSPEILFGLSYEYIKPGQTLLDIGIGTGLSSELFHKAGLHIYGIDGSEEMLDMCKSKNITVELKQHDLLEIPLPYPNASFHHVMVNGVFHLLGDIEPLLGETARLIEDGGIFGFTYDEQKPGEPDGYVDSGIEGISEKINEKSGVKSFRHGDGYIAALLKTNGFVLLKKLEFLAFRASPWDKEKFFQACIAKKQKGYNRK